ncbi:MAG: tyrosine-type recombinase/integrase [Chloroflexi bacterium]|nr:tyrosine-type recombinase/integrase [Chloroflexota bacterium]
MKDRIETFLQFLLGERGVSANTVSAYRNDLSQFADYLAGATDGGTPLAMVDRERLAGYFLHLKERGYAPASVARKVAATKSFFHYLRRQGELSADPTDGLGTPEVKKTPPRSISADDVRLLFQQAQVRESPEATRDVAMLRGLYATGMRISEMVTLDVQDADLAEGTVEVAGRGGRSRLLPIDALTVRSLRAYLEKARPYLTRHDLAQTALFLNHRGQRLTRQGFWLIMKALVRDAGLTVLVTPHTLRHSFAAHRVGDGLALQQLQQLLGHASLSTTQIYAQTPPAAPVADHAARVPAPRPAPRGRQVVAA